MKKNTKTILSVLAAGVFSCALLSQQAQAIPITGSIDMSGTATLDNASLGSATKATSLTMVTVGGTPTGAYAGTAGTPVTWSPFAWVAGATYPPVTPLWSFAFNPGGGLRTYTFDLLSVSISSQNSTFLNLLGTGTLKITGVGPIYDDTTGRWSFTISNPTGGDHPNFAFTFANSQTSVPDGGLTVALLGFALVGVEGLRRKLTA